MKSIKDHFMFILPLLAMLIGIEFVLVFNRITATYEEKLKNDYAVLVVSKRDLTTPYLRSVDNKIDSVTTMDKTKIASEVISDVKKDKIKNIIKDLPQFYRVHLTEYVPLKKLKEIKSELEALNGVLSVEIFDKSYESRHSLFALVKNTLKVFVTIMFIVSLLLIIKQMEVWQLGHKSRMKIMETFGAPLMLRSGVLFKMAFIDAIIATMVTFLIFMFIQSKSASIETIKFLEQDSNLLFNVSDIFVWMLTGMIIVVISVLFVAFKTSGSSDEI